MAKVLVEILSDPLQLQRYQEAVADPGAGATATFTGTTRDTFEGKRVVQLEYEAYEPMAKKALQVKALTVCMVMLNPNLWARLSWPTRSAAVMMISAFSCRSSAAGPLTNGV